MNMKKFSKKQLLVFGSIGVLLTIALVSAGVYLYVGSASVLGQVDEPLTVTGGDVVFEMVYPGDSEIQTVNIANAGGSDLNVDLTYAEQNNNYVLSATKITDEASTEAGRDAITIVFNSGPVTLGDLADINFDQYVEDGSYPASVNILLDMDGDFAFNSRKDLTTGYLTGGVDDVLKIEWADNGGISSGYTFPDAYMNPDNSDYNRWLNVFPSGAMTGDTMAWLYSAMPGSTGKVEATLDTWKAGKSNVGLCYQNIIGTPDWTTEECDITVDASTLVYGIEIESLGWIAASSSKVRNIQIDVVGAMGGASSYGANGVIIDTPTGLGAKVIPAGGNLDVPITFVIAGNSPVGQFTGKINVERTA